VGTKVLVHDGHDWARKCWSARGMSGHESVGPLEGMIYPSSTGTRTCCRCFLHRQEQGGQDHVL
jgi:hypothetical protein